MSEKPFQTVFSRAVNTALNTDHAFMHRDRPMFLGSELGCWG